MEVPKENKEIFYSRYLVAALAGLLALFMMLAFIKYSRPDYWPRIKYYLLGPFDTWPRKGITNFNSYGAYLYSLVGILIVDYLALRKRSAFFQLLRFEKSERNDLIVAGCYIFGLTFTLPTLLTGGATVFIPQYLSRWRLNFIDDLFSVHIQVLVWLVVLDFFHYWWHRAMHESRILWEFHAFHHSATSFTILTGNRVHPVEMIMKTLLVTIPMLFIGAPTTSIFLYLFVRRLFDLAQHSFVPITYGRFGKYVIFSPIGHRIHHSDRPEHFDSNYGNIFSCWDHLFGTWYSGNELNEAIGIPNNDFNKDGLVSDLCRPFSKAAQFLGRR
tara:strand:- start:754 stop:1740 length:987 start_codon:yes stop_codon:yes gene_type:complete